MTPNGVIFLFFSFFALKLLFTVDKGWLVTTHALAT